MSTISDVQNAMVDIITPSVYPQTTAAPSVALNKVSSVTTNVAGSGYTNAIAEIVGDGYGAQVYPNLIGGEVVAITAAPDTSPNYGFGYSQIPSVNITGNGTGAVATANISPVNIYIAAGDFLKQNLDYSLAQGDAFVSVFAINGMTRNTTRLRREYCAPVYTAATITLTVNDDTVTVGGTITVDQASMVIVNGIGYSYAALMSDTPTTIATALAALIPTATSAGAVITVPNVFDIVARVSRTGTARQILHSTEGLFRVRVIAPSHELRELIGDTVQLAIAENGYYLNMPDLISASIRPKSIAEVNTYELANAFARDYIYLVEYHVVQVTNFQTIADAYAVTSIVN